MRALQQFLNAQGFLVAETGPGSQGNETASFFALTQSALIQFQALYGIVPAVGYFGPQTRAKVAEFFTPEESDSASLSNPTSLKVEKALSGHVDLSWNAVEGAESYIIKRKEYGANNYTMIGTTTTTTFTDSTVSFRTNYSYIVTAKNAGGESRPSSVVGAYTSSPGGGGGGILNSSVSDAISPTVSLTAPSSGATVEGDITVSANASDDIGVVGVQFKVNTNTNIGLEDTSSPYSITWDSTSIADSSHTLIAVARDVSGNYATSSPVTITVANDTATSSITQYGITWTFDGLYQYGQFESGDYWVVGPVTIESVSPGWDGTTNGSMVDPVPLEAQGFDSRANYTFDNDNRTTFPVTLNATSSLISTIGLGSCVSGGGAECLDTAAVLTVVSASVPSNSFRPPYVAGDKPVWNTADVDYDLLPGLPTPDDDVPDLDGVMVRPWIDFGPKSHIGTSIRPQSNMDAYPRDSSIDASRIAAYVLTDQADVNEVSNRLIQYGIDLYDISLDNENGWEAIGGFGSGRKWPILFAGLMLDSSTMQNVATTTNAPYANNEKFGEDGHTYYGQATGEYPNGKPLWGQDCASDGIYDPWFVNHDCRDPDGLVEPQQMTNGGGYQACCTSQTWIGAALAAHRMSATTTWSHPAFFDYLDRWVDEPTMWAASTTEYHHDVYGYGGDGNGFMKAMWDTYRDVTLPTLSGASASTTGATIADLSVLTNEDNGTLYFVVTTSSTGPTVTQVKSGLDHLGVSATDSGTTTVSLSGVQTASSTGLTAETMYYAHFMHEDNGTNQSIVVTSSSFTTDEADITAPTLSNPIDTADGETAGTGSVDTNEGNGTLYFVVTQSATSPSSAQVKAGQNHTGSTADDSGSQSVSSTGTQNISGGFTGLTSSTTYYTHYMHEDASTNQSPVLSADGFTTDAEAIELATNWAFTGNTTGWTLGNGWAFHGANRASYSSGDTNAKVEQTVSVSSGTEYRLLTNVMNVTAANGSVVVEVIERNGVSPQTYSNTVSLSALGGGNDMIPIIFTTSADCTSVTISIKPNDNTAIFHVDFMSLKEGNELILDPNFAIHAAGDQTVWNANANWNFTPGEAHYDGGGGFDVLALISQPWLDTGTNYNLRVTVSEIENSSGSIIGRIYGTNNVFNIMLSSVTPPQILSGTDTPATNSSDPKIFQTSGSSNFKVTEMSLKPTE